MKEDEEKSTNLSVLRWDCVCFGCWSDDANLKNTHEIKHTVQRLLVSVVLRSKFKLAPMV